MSVLDSDTQKKWQKAKTVVDKLRSYIMTHGSLKYIVYHTKAKNVKSLKKDIDFVDIHFHQLKNVEVARIELAIEKIDDELNLSELMNGYHKIGKAISSLGKSSTISVEEKKTLTKAITNFAKQVSIAETHYMGIIETIRKYPTIEALNQSKEAQTISHENYSKSKEAQTQDSAVENDVVQYGKKKVVENNYRQVGIMALVVITLFIMNKFL